MIKMRKKDYSEIAQIFKVLSNQTRIEILDMVKDNEVAVLEIAKHLHKAKANISQHLAILRYLGLVSARRDGKHIFYKTKNPGIMSILKFLKGSK